LRHKPGAPVPYFMPAAKRFNAATRMKRQASRVCGFNSAIADSALARAAPSTFLSDLTHSCAWLPGRVPPWSCLQSRPVPDRLLAFFVHDSVVAKRSEPCRPYGRYRRAPGHDGCNAGHDDQMRPRADFLIRAK